MSVKRKFTAVLVGMTLGLGAVLALVDYRAVNEELSGRATLESANAVSEIRALLDVTDDIMRARVESSMKLLMERGTALGEASQGSKVMVDTTEVPELLLGGQPMANQFQLVDSLTSIMGGTATLFSRSGDDFVRVSTNVMNNGKRAIGTKLAPDGKAMAAIRQGKAFYGQVDILGKPYLTGYEPLRNAAGDVIGIWYVGYSANLDALADIIGRMKVLDNGFVALRDGKDAISLHSSSATVDAINAAISNPGSQWKLDVISYDRWGYDIVVAQNSGDVAAMIAKRLGTDMLLLGGLMLVVLVVLQQLVAGIVMHPLQRQIDAIRKIADGEGDLTTRINSSRDDEFGQMSRHFDHLLDRLQGTIRDVGSQAARVQGASAELSRLSVSMSQVQVEQSDKTRMLASAAHELSVSAQEVAQNSDGARSVASDACSEVRRGTDMLRDTSVKIRQQASSIEESEKVVSMLADESANISTVLDVIRNIAEQTNLLALNAAIEAARAGEQGRGFAVVADEVRSLASRTQASTQEINSMVEKLQRQGKQATGLMQENRQQAARNAELTEEVTNMISQVLGSMERINHLNAEIARTTTEQRSVSETMSSDVEDIYQASSRNQEMAGAAERAARELGGSVDSLRALLANYRV